MFDKRWLNLAPPSKMVQKLILKRPREEMGTRLFRRNSLGRLREGKLSKVCPFPLFSHPFFMACLVLHERMLLVDSNDVLNALISAQT